MWLIILGQTNFRSLVEEVVSQIPKGRVMTYGQIAAICGNPRAARIVGGIAHYGNPSLPWQRVVNKRGGLAVGYPGGRESHRKQLELEGIAVASNYRINIEKLQWTPNPY